MMPTNIARLWRFACAFVPLLLCFGSAAQADTYNYDLLGRLTSVIAANGDRQVFTYDAAGNLLSAANSTTVVSYQLALGSAGTGSGIISSSPSGISCGATCSASFTSGSSVTLTATPATGSSFAGWTGACTGTGTCVVNMSTAQSVTATFTAAPVTYALAVSKIGSGSGTVSSSPAGISCGATCNASLTSGSSVTLTAAATTGSNFAGWAGACTGSAPTCTLSMSQAQTVTASFVTAPSTFTLTVTKAGSGSGSISSSPAAISCGTTCSANFASGSNVNLAAVPATGSVFGGWSGACTGSGSCSVSMSSAQNITATFSLAGTVPLPTVSKISAGLAHTCALTSSGAVKCWGANATGQLGDNTTRERHTPVDVTGLSTGVADISTGLGHSCALTTTGSLKCWGYNSWGQLGDNTMTDRLVPVDVIGLSSGATAVSAGKQINSCALTAAGGVKCWGYNHSGQLGNDTVRDQWIPGDVIGLSSGARAVSVGSNHACAITALGVVKCWGDNTKGQLGDGSVTDRHTPAAVVGLGDSAVAIAAGSQHTCALTAAGGVKCWGNNVYAQLGDNSTADRTYPVDVTGLRTGVIAISAGNSHTCALTAQGGVKCWGRNHDGQLGDGTTTDRYTPVDVVGLTRGGASISAGGYHTCAVTAGGEVVCWGLDQSGQLGDNTPVQLAPSCTLSSAPANPAAGTYTLTADCYPEATFFFWDPITTGCANPWINTCVVTPAATTTYALYANNSFGSSNLMRATVVVNPPFTGNRADYRITVTGGIYSITDLVAGRDGTRVVSAGDHLRFADMTANLTIQSKAATITSATLQRLEELYVAFFNRVPDADGLAYWIDQYSAGQSINQIADNFYAAAVGSYAAQTGYSASMSNTDFITKIYQNVLGRSSPDADGLSYWLGALANGAQTRGSLVNTILEAAHTYKGNADASLAAVADLLDNKIVVANRFAVTLGLSYNDAANSISRGTAIAAAVTSGSSAAAIALIGVSDGQGAPLTATANFASYQLSGKQDQVATTLEAAPALVVAPAPLPEVGPFTGMWGNPLEPGWGMSITQHDNKNFVVVYSYDQAGQPTWYSMSSCPLTGYSCTGDIFRVSGGTPATQQWNGTALALTSIGTGTLTFADADNASYSFALDGVASAKAITRRTFATGATAPSVDWTDLWTSPNEPGWGVTLTQQYGVIFAAMHSYDWIGQPTWYVASSCPIVGNGCTGDLYQVTGGYPLTSTWYGASKTAKVGTINFSFSNASIGTMTYSINGAAGSRSISRQAF